VSREDGITTATPSYGSISSDEKAPPSGVNNEKGPLSNTQESSAKAAEEPTPSSTAA